MPQFAVYRNPGRNSDIPFVVQIQSRRLEARVGRVITPLFVQAATSTPNHALTPHLFVCGQWVIANRLELTTIASKRLTEILAIISDPDQERIIRAIDEMISQA